MSNLRCSGVYIITNTIDGTVYIGSSRNITRRWGTHKRLLRKQTHFNIHLQRAYNVYGMKCFAIGILETGVNDLLLREQHWLNKCWGELRLYNISKDAVAPMSGRKQKQRVIDIHQRAYPAFRNIHTGQVIPAGKNLSALARQLGVGQSALWGVKTRRTYSAGGWTLADESRKHKGLFKYPALKNERTGESVTSGINLSNFCQIQKLNVSHMFSVVHGKRRSHKGWVVADANRQDTRYDKKTWTARGYSTYPVLVNIYSGAQLIFDSVKELCQEYELDASSIYATIRGNYKGKTPYKGWVAAYGDSA